MKSVSLVWAVPVFDNHNIVNNRITGVVGRDLAQIHMRPVENVEFGVAVMHTSEGR